MNTKFGIIFWPEHFKCKQKSWIRNLEKSTVALLLSENWFSIFTFFQVLLFLFWIKMTLLKSGSTGVSSLWCGFSFSVLLCIRYMCTYFVISISTCQRKKLWDIQWFGIKRFKCIKKVWLRLTTQYDMFMVFKVLEINCTLMQDLFCWSHSLCDFIYNTVFHILHRQPGWTLCPIGWRR